jgi:hypothetical protein
VFVCTGHDPYRLNKIFLWLCQNRYFIIFVQKNKTLMSCPTLFPDYGSNFENFKIWPFSSAPSTSDFICQPGKSAENSPASWIEHIRTKNAWFWCKY